MIEFQIAGAGAGKTYGLAEKISKRLKNTLHSKKLYALTFTNTAKDKIQFELNKHVDSSSQNLCIETVHSFLLNEIIFPYSNYILNTSYNCASTVYLGTNKIFKSSKIKKLKDKKIVHVEVVYKIAKNILNKKFSSNKKKKQHDKIDKVLALLSNCIDSIFIDEIQDLDENALTLFEILSDAGIYVYMIGDPKQAIKWPTALAEFMKKIDTTKNLILDPINYSRRVPYNILQHSNRFCYSDQIQNSLSSELGSISYIDSTNLNFEALISYFIKDNKSIVCIDKKNFKYETNYFSTYSFPITIATKILEKKTGYDENKLLSAAFKEFSHDIQKLSSYNVIKNLKIKYLIELDKIEFAQLFEIIDVLKRVKSKYIVSSIDSIKGLECENCVFILNDNMFSYFSQLNLNPNQKFNKEWKKVYVALTRAKKNVILAVDCDIFKKFSIEMIKKKFDELSVSEYQKIQKSN